MNQPKADPDHASASSLSSLSFAKICDFGSRLTDELLCAYSISWSPSSAIHSPESVSPSRSVISAQISGRGV
jgi:hypothetical protein